MLADGHSYERSAIEDWFGRGQNTSPKTGGLLEHTNIVPNVNLRHAIEAHRAADGKKKMAAPETAMAEPTPALERSVFTEPTVLAGTLRLLPRPPSGGMQSWNSNFVQQWLGSIGIQQP